MKYFVVIAPLSEEDGGGYLGWVPDLKGCMSDGDTPEEALANVESAIGEWIAECKRLGRAVPKPGSAAKEESRERAALEKALGAIDKHQTDIDVRIDDLAGEIRELLEIAENLDSWRRFHDITGVPNSVARQRSRAST